MNNSPDDGKVGYLPKSPKWGSWETTKSNKEGDNVKIDNSKLDVLLARRCMTIADLRKEASSQTLTRIRRGESVKPITAGKIALALGVDVTDIIENTAATVDNGKQGISEAK